MSKEQAKAIRTVLSSLWLAVWSSKPENNISGTNTLPPVQGFVWKGHGASRFGSCHCAVIEYDYERVGFSYTFRFRGVREGGVQQASKLKN